MTFTKDITFYDMPINATNGDMIKRIFPISCIHEHEGNEDYPFVDVFYGYEDDNTDMNSYRKTWWNAPYKKGE